MIADDFTRKVHRVTKVTDGDTLVAEIDLGYRISATLPIRLYPWDAPETKATTCPECHLKASTYEKQQAQRAKNMVQTWLDFAPKQLWLSSHGSDPDGEYGRWLGDLWFEDPKLATLGEALFAAGLATQWPTRWHEVHDPDRDRR